MIVSSSLSRALRRLALWSLPVALTASLAVGVHRVEALRSIDQARDLLVAGDHAAVSDLLESRLESPWVGAQARAGVQIARAFVDDRATAPADSAALDAEPYPLPVVIRAAFERGEFGSVLRLTELAESLGQPTVPLVTVAARIEDGQAVPSADAAIATPSTSRLASRVADHLAAPRTAGVILRDRSGRPIGRLADGVFHRVDEVPEHWIPRAVESLGSSHPDAGSLRLALDLDLTRAAARAFGRFRGSIVLVDPRTGEILTAISDRRTHARIEGTPAFEQVREPASIAKLITTAAYLRAGSDPDHRLRRMRCRGHVFYDGEPVYCPYIAGPLRGLDRAMAVSCNVAFAELGVEVGRRRVLDEMRRWGFGRRLGAFRSGAVVAPPIDDRQLADLSIGLEASEITPLHAALMAAVVANGGRLPEPTLLRSADGRLGLHPRPVAFQDLETVLDPETADVLHDAMRAVVDRGTAMRVRTPGFPVAMKTGTASHPSHGFHVNYIGYGPLPDARLAFCVRITNQGTSKQVRYAATEVTARLLRNLRSVARERGWLDPVPPRPSIRVAGTQDERAAGTKTGR